MATNVDIIAANALATEFNTDIVYHDDAPEHGTYPIISYTDLQENPALHADNKLYGHEHIIRVTIITHGNAGINELKTRVFNCMTEAGFMWQTTNKTRDGKEYYTTMDFSYSVNDF